MKKLTYLLIILIFFQAISALGGGFGLLSDVSGSSMGFSVEMLKHSPFTNFLIPGLFLFIVLGILPAIIGVGLIKKKLWSLKASFYLGIILVLWIILEIIFIREFAMLQLVYFLLGIMITILSRLKVISSNFKK
jgi:hypothetical protein